MAKLSQKIYTILWKHAVVKKRNIIGTLFEIILPVVLVLVPSFLFHKGLHKQDTETYTAQDPAEVLSSSLLKNYSTHIYYVPSTSFTNKLMNSVDDALQSIRRTIVGMKNEDDILHAFNTSEDNKSVIFIGIIFDDIKEAELPKTLNYQLRSKKNLKIKKTFSENAPEGPNPESGQYIDTGIGALQLFIDSFFIDEVRKEAGLHSKDLNIKRLVQKFPHPPYIRISLDLMTNLFVNFIMMGFLLACYCQLLKNIVSEKETGLKEFLKVNGLKTWMLLTSWLVNTLFVNMISVTGIVLVIKLDVQIVKPLIQTTDATLLWAFLAMFCISSVFFIFALSSLFENPITALVVGLIAYSAPSFAVMYISDSAARTVDLLLCLLPTGGLCHGMDIILQNEIRGNRLQWNNVIFPPVGNPDHITMADVFLMYFVGIIIFTLITWYMDAVKPGKYGVAKPWYYLCMVCFPSNNSIENQQTQANVTENFETPPDNLMAGIRITNLFKKYTSRGKSESNVAVNGVTLDIYHGEITALLGHNGAGKTTIMSILSGIFSPTSGSVMINEYDIKNNMDKIRDNLGICPQHSILISQLTVEEHLIFFGMLKGLSKKTAKDMSKDILNKLDLAEKSHCLQSKLSGGMKRKLSLGIALTGDAKVLILDEPTSGLDVEARRKVWNLLLSMRGQKTILFSTHYMEEADVLGDRVAIMSHGKIKCYGTTLFLKKRYGTGYNLCVIKLDGCSESAVYDTIAKNIPEATIKGSNGPLMHFSLPLDQTSKFPKLFDSLEGNKKKLQIGGVGVSLTTLEDVFLNVGKEREDEASEYSSITNGRTDEFQRGVDATGALTISKVSGLKLILRQCSALLLNNILFVNRNLLPHIIKLLPSLLLTYQSINISQMVFGTDSDTSSHVFSLNNYGRTEVFLHPELCGEDLIQSYKREIESTKSKLTVITNSTDLKEALLHQAISNVIKFRNKIIIAAEFKCLKNSVQANAMYSNVALHGFPISVNMMSNALLKFFSNGFSIIFSYHPFKTEESPMGFDVAIVMVPLFWLSISFGLGYLVLNYIQLPLMERVSKSKHIKLMAGVNPITYWLSHFLCDFMCYLVGVITLPILISVTDHQGLFTKSDILGVFLLLLILHGFAAIPFSYVYSFLADTYATASDSLVLFNALIGVLGCVLVHFLDLYNKMKKWEVDDLLKVTDLMLHLIPQYTLSCSIKKYIIIILTRKNCMVTKERGCEEDMPYFSETFANEHDLTLEAMFFGIDCGLYFFILLLIEFGFIKKLYSLTENLVFRRRVVRDDDVAIDDDDVKEEKLRVKEQLQGRESKDALLVYNLVKYYRSFPAVKGISFGVKEGECFGLLGTNGAGKTTSFQMLTGDIIPTSGKMSFYGYKLSKNKSKYLSHIGYCPQFDALDQYLTGNEILSMYAKLRGVPDGLIAAQIDSWINLLGLNEYQEKVCGTYSGGNKRKLSAAVALIGNPPIVILDEPTTGVDPVSRRKLWNVLHKIQKTGQAVVLTSHSMEECEALCTRLAIMVAGRFICVGNSQYLKQKFGQGFSVMIKTKFSESDIEEVNEVKSWFQEKEFPNVCILKDEHLGLLLYQITDLKVTLKQLFTTLEEMKKRFKVVEDYAVSETTLEQIFLSFARKNSDRNA